jgi:3-hydroxyacyl-CoA dehydrogenase
MTESDVTKRMSLLTGVTGMEAAKEADIVVEAAFEEIGVKREIFGNLDRLT